MKNLIILVAGIMFAIVTLSSCKTQKANTKTSSQAYVDDRNNNEIVNKYWKLIEIQGKPVVFENKDIGELHMIFKEEDNIVSGFLGCNNFLGHFQLLDGNRILFSKMTVMSKMCFGESMEIEDKFIEVLQMVDNYNINDNILTLNRARMAPLAKFEVVYME